MKKLIDLTHTIVNGLPVYPGDHETRLSQTKSVHKDGYNNHRLEIDVHAGTHMDSPMHFFDTGEYISELPLDTFIGEGCLLDVRGEQEIAYREEFNSIVKEGSIVLLYTGKDTIFGEKEYYSKHPVLTMEMSEFLAERKVKLVGMDLPSPDKYPFDIHKKLFKSNILIIENLTNLGELKNLKSFEIMAFPLRIDADSSILRVVARELD
ncbi:MAG: cyclase family protein [Clostridia bacterium]|jgi:kynurenine formamidase|nr:cyclase family protein [Clostridia bacterium]